MNIISFSAIITSPVVPRIDPVSVEAPRAISAPRAQGLGPEAFGAGLGRGLQQVSSDMFQSANEERAKAVRTMTIEGRTKLDQKEVDLLYHPEKGALAKRGKDAFSLEEPVLKSFDETAAEIEKGMTDQEAKSTFRLFAQQRRVEVDKQLQRHVHGEMKSYAEEANKASLESTLNNIAMHYNDPNRIELERKFGLGVIMSDTDNKGLPPQAVKLKADTWESMVHRAVIDKLTVENASKAQEYFDANRDRILPTDAAKIERELKPLATKQVGMDTALELAPLLGAKPLTEVLSEVRTRLKSNPDALNIAETQLKQMEVERRDQLKQEADEAARPVYKRIAEIQLSGRAAKLSDIPAAEWAELVRKSPEDAGKIQDAIRREIQAEQDRRERVLDRAERRADRAERKAEQGNMNQLMNWAALNGDPESLMRANLDSIFTQGLIGKEHYRSLSNKQAELRANPDKGVAIRTESQTVEDVLGAVKIKKGSEKHADAWDFIETRKKMFVAEHNRQPTRKELQEIARESVYKVDIPWAKDKRLYEMTFEDIPQAERAKIVDAFNRRGRAYTEADVVRAYGRVKMKGGR